MQLRTLVATGAAVLVLLGACGGGGPKATTPTTNEGPGAAIDPDANGVLTGPVNKARSTVTAVNNQQQQMEQQTAPEG